MIDDSSETAFWVADARRAGRTRRWVDNPRLERPFYGVRVPKASTPPAHPRDRQRADIRRAALQFRPRMPDTGYFSHTTAAVLWDLPLPLLADTSIHFSTPTRAVRTRGVHGHQIQAGLVEVVRHPVLNVPLTDPASTWAMMGAALARLYDVVAVGDAVVRVPRIPGPAARIERPALATSAQLETAMNAGRRVGVAHLREALPLIRVGAASRPETWVRLILVDAGCPEPVLDHDVYDERGVFVGCVDLAYPRLRIAIEYEGDQHRTDPRQWQRDIEKHERLADLGWRVIRVPRDDVFRHPERLVRRVKNVSASRA